MSKVSFCVDMERPVIIDNFEKRGWIHVKPEDNWNVYWTTIRTCRNLFKMHSNHFKLKDHQMVNHFPNHYELSRKDLLIR